MISIAKVFERLSGNRNTIFIWKKLNVVSAMELVEVSLEITETFV